MCFAPQRRALFRHLNFQKWSEPGVFCTLRLGNVLRATTACNFSSLIWSAGSAPAALAILLFDPPKPRTIVFVHPYVQCNTLNWKIMHLNICSGTVQMPFFSWNVFYPKSKTIPTGPAARARSGKRTVTGCAKNRSSHTKPYTPVIGYICIWYMYPNIFIQGFMPC